jgi:hypothetical protein
MYQDKADHFLFWLFFNWIQVDNYLAAKGDKKAISTQIYDTYFAPKAPTPLSLNPEWEEKIVCFHF